MGCHGPNFYKLLKLYLYRECDDDPSRPKCEGLSYEEENCSVDKCPCKMDMNVVRDELGKTAFPDAWVDDDGEPGRTEGDSVVNEGDELDEGVIIHVYCNNW
jgi:hypothetical protein